MNYGPTFSLAPQVYYHTCQSTFDMCTHTIRVRCANVSWQPVVARWVARGSFRYTALSPDIVRSSICFTLLGRIKHWNVCVREERERERDRETETDRETDRERGDLRCVYVLLYIVACLFNVCVCVPCVDAVGPPGLLCRLQSLSVVKQHKGLAAGAV